MDERLSRTALLLGEEAVETLAGKRVAVFGVGGVGGFAVEALVRSGIGAIDIVDNDTVAPSNLNRQIIALGSTIGRYKVDVCEERIKDISPGCKVTKHRVFFTPETARGFDFTQFDYVIDAIDTVTGKIELVMRANAAGVPIISSMGAGNKLDPTRFEVADIYKTSVCPLAKVMRRELRERGVKKLKVVFSKEPPASRGPQNVYSDSCEHTSPVFSNSETPDNQPASRVSQNVYSDSCEHISPVFSNSETPDNRPASRRSVPGSVAFVPSIVGLIIAGEVIKDLCGTAGSR